MRTTQQQDIDSRLRSVAQSEYDLARWKYDSEQRREDSLIRQSGQMQSAFSFITAALFMALPVMVQYRGCLPLEFFLVVGVVITVPLLLSLVFATIAQSRRKQETLQDCAALIAGVEVNEALFQTDTQRLKYLATVYQSLQPSLTENNCFRVVWIHRSMGCFYTAVGLCAICGAVGVIWLMIGG